MTIFLVLLFLLLILVFARQAWYDGVLVQYWGILGLAGGIGTGFLFFQLLVTATERLDADRPLSLGMIVIISVMAGLLMYFIVRGIAKFVLCKFFGEESAYGDWTDEWRGAVLSLVPSLITILILAAGLRLGGTLMEWRHLEYLCRPRAQFTAGKYPSWPVWVKCRDSVEGIPVLGDGLDVLDPISRTPERHIVSLLIASKKPGLLRYLQSEPETAPIFNSFAMREVLGSDDVRNLLKRFQHVSLIKHPLVHQAARDPEASKALADLELQRLIDAFMLSPDWQG